MRRDPLAGSDALLPSRAVPAPLSYETAAAMRRPRRCHVPWHRRGGCLCCDLCTSQAFSGRQVVCLSSDDPPLFRPFPEEPNR